jgi:phospholipase/carboxylesterase
VADDDERLLDAITALVPALLGGLEALRHAGRHLHPPELAQRVAEIASAEVPLAGGLRAFDALDWPAGLEDFRRAATASAEQALAGLQDLAAAVESSNPVLAAYRALAHQWRALEALYPIAGMLPPVSRYFLNDSGRADAGLNARLEEADHGRSDAGVMHAANETSQRGGFSLYVPEYQRADQPLPLVVALHGGSGHGRGFLWNWLRDARSSGCLLIAPTSGQDTWALMGPDTDTPNILGMVERVQAHWPVDSTRILLTGMSDGATFSWVCGLRDSTPFTHLAPVAGTFHPLLVEGASVGRLAGLPVYLVHGSLDWMFPVEVARMACDTLTAAGADVTFREIADLSHTYPVEENARILEWFMRPR